MKRSALLILPCLVLCIMFSVVPMALSAVAGLWRIDFQENSFVGLGNYWKALRDQQFIGSLVNGLVYAVLVTGGYYGIGIPLGLAVGDLPKSVRRKVQTALYVPGLAIGTIVAALWRFAFNPIMGPFHGLFNVWSNRWTAIAAVSLIIITGGASTVAMTVSVLASSVGNEVREAARIDGASEWKVRWGIVLPSIGNVVLVMMIFCMIGATQIWETIQAVSLARPNTTSGGPIWEIFDTGFTRIQYGLACAKTTLYLLSLGLVMFVVRFVKK